MLMNKADCLQESTFTRKYFLERNDRFTLSTYIQVFIFVLQTIY